MNDWVTSDELFSIWYLILSSQFQRVLKSRVKCLTFEFFRAKHIIENYWICGFLLGEERNIPAVKETLWQVTAYIQRPLLSVKDQSTESRKRRTLGCWYPHPPPPPPPTHTHTTYTHTQTHYEVNSWIWTEHCRYKILNKKMKNKKKKKKKWDKKISHANHWLKHC